MRRASSNVATTKDNAAGIGAKLACDQPKQRAFASAIGPNNAQGLARSEAEAEFVGYDQRAISFAEALDSEDYGHFGDR
jgi:hypothetical protein